MRNTCTEYEIGRTRILYVHYECKEKQSYGEDFASSVNDFSAHTCVCISTKKCCVIISKLYKNLYEIYSALHSMDSRRFLPLTRLNPRSQSIIVIFIRFTCREAFVSYFQHVQLLFKENIFLNFGFTEILR